MNYKFHPYGYTMSNNPNVAVPLIDVKIRKAINPLILKIARKVNSLPIEVLYDERINKKRPKIYIATHGFPEDVLNSAVAIDSPCYILAGNKEVFLYSKEGVATWIYGGIGFDRLNSESRKSAFYKMERVLKLGSSILLFPEGAWNMSITDIIADLNGGFYDLSMVTGIDIVPIVTHPSIDKRCLTYVGSEIDVRHLDINTLKLIYDYIIKCFNKCYDLPISQYSSYIKIKTLLDKNKNEIFDLLSCNYNTDIMEENIVKIRNIVLNTINNLNEMLNDDNVWDEEKSIIKRINIYLKAISNARKRVVISLIRDDMIAKKFEFMEKFGEKRKRNSGTTLQDDIELEKQKLISRVSHYDYDEEQKSMFVDPIKVDLNEPFSKIKIKRI